MKKKLLFLGLAILIFLIGFLSGSFWTTTKLFRTLPGELSKIANTFDEKEATSFIRSPTSMNSSFWGAIFWGGMPGRIDRLEPLPDGKGILKGRFMYGEKPASGIKFRMALNGNYRTKFIRSDDNGEFSISLPPGTWHLNNLQCKEWKNRPEGQFVLISGDEANLNTSSFSDLFFLFSDKGKAIEVSDESNPAISLNILIRSKMKILWPLPNEPKQKGTVSRSEIKWEPFPNASSYVIKISRVTRESSRSTIFSPILYKRVNGTTSIPISQLPNAQDDTSKEEYAVRIRAYDIKGNFLTEAEHSFST